jgi:hypothetical protein
MLTGLRQYAMARPPMQAAIRAKRGPLQIADEDWIDPTRVASAPFMDAIQQLDARLYGERGLTAPRWALYDCAGLPGVILGFGRRASQMADADRARLSVPDGYEGLVPLSMSIATPMLGDHRWLLTTLGAVSDGAATAQELADETFRFAADTLPARDVIATVQWDSPELAVFARHAPLHVLAAWLPAHDLPATAVVRFGVPRSEGPLPPEVVLDPTDVQVLRDLQRDIEAGAAITIKGSVTYQGGAPRVPLRRKAAP